MRYSSLSSMLMVALAAWQVSGSIIEARSSLEFILKRQTSDICTAECSTFQDAASACSDTTGSSCPGLCTRSVAAGLNTCVNCLYEAAPTATVLASANRLINTYEEVCAGVPGLPDVSVTGAGGSTPTSATSRALPTTATTSDLPSTTSRATVRVSTTAETTAAIAPGTTVAPPPGASSTGGSSTGGGNGGLPGLGNSAASLSFSGRIAVAALAISIGAAFSL